MLQTVTELGYLDDVALITIRHIPNIPQCLAAVMGTILHHPAAMDMSCYAPPCRDEATFSFTLPQESLPEVIGATSALKALSSDICTDVNGNNTKFILSGLDTAGTANFFETLSDANIPTKWVSVTKNQLSCLVDITDAEKVKQLLEYKKHFI